MRGQTYWGTIQTAQCECSLNAHNTKDCLDFILILIDKFESNQPPHHFPTAERGGAGLGAESNLMGLHEARGASVSGQSLAQLGLQTLHLSGDGLQGALVALLLLQSLVQRLLLLTDLRGQRLRLRDCCILSIFLLSSQERKNTEMDLRMMLTKPFISYHNNNTT